MMMKKKKLLFSNGNKSILSILLFSIPLFSLICQDGEASAQNKKPEAPRLVYSYVYSYATCTRPHQLPVHYGVASDVFPYCPSGERPSYSVDALDSVVRAAKTNCPIDADLVMTVPDLVDPHANRVLAEQDRESTCTQILGGGCISIAWHPETFYSNLNSTYKKNLKNCIP